ncbi:hypothetical protein PVA8_389 [Vibrio phage PVA8]|nr:hypothetical protein [Vibrio phage PC-Liy1]URQ03375.1 hypothetical protein PVA8_389 [Vibrio phage PVA8]WBM59108.1 hypothetical protein vBValMPVA8_386 [Vibrio phage vB_ValM_PVA8]
MFIVTMLGAVMFIILLLVLVNEMRPFMSEENKTMMLTFGVAISLINLSFIVKYASFFQLLLEK